MGLAARVFYFIYGIRWLWFLMKGMKEGGRESDGFEEREREKESCICLACLTFEREKKKKSP